MDMSKSTDKLQIVADSALKNILLDDSLKQKIKSININWGSHEGTCSEYVVAPDVSVEFKD